MRAMPAKLVSDNGEHVVIRPLAFCKESELIQYGQLKKFPIIPSNLCGSQPNLQRQNIKAMLNQWSDDHPGRIESMFTAMKNIVPSHMCDGELFDFKNMDSDVELPHGGDTAFDQEVMTSKEASVSPSKYTSSPLTEINAVNIVEVT